MAPQVDHVAGFLEGELSASGEADLVVVGHSIGAWVALEAVRRLGANQRRVSACLGLMPYLATETEDAGRKAALICQWFAPALIWLLAGVAQLIGWLPVRAWRMAGLRLLEPEIAGYDPDQREIVEMSLPRFGTHPNPSPNPNLNPNPNPNPNPTPTLTPNPNPNPNP